ncbi:MAG: hypothetical protein QOI47_238 [Actinomycetota bacterium]|jgi:hypothetical protein|nr:hypothetical protein [Actinomycetota bacterium]
MPMTARRALLLATLVAVVLAIVPLGRTAARAALPYYAAIANAESARVTYTIPGAPLTDAPVDGGGTRSQASSGGIDGGRAYAAAPDPGQGVVGAPSLLRGVAGVDLPEYPLAATSQDPVHPEQTVDQPGIHLHAASSEQHSDAETVTGSTNGQVQTTATAGAVGDEVSAHAEAIVRELDAGPLRISGVRSAATLTRHADGSITRKSELTVASASIAGAPISVSANGVTIANTTTPLPDRGPLRDVLVGAGIDVHVLAGESTDTGVTSPALVITTPFTSLTGKPGTATYVIGRAAALLDVIAPPASPTAIAADVLASGSGSSTPIATSAGSTMSPSIGSIPSPVPTATRSIAGVRGTPIEWQLRNIYLAFVIAALVLSVGNAALRHLGVRS